MSSEFKAIQPFEYYRTYVEQNLRPDGRNLWDFRETNLNVGSISHADGSALVKLGNTTVVCGIKAELAEPSAESPNEGFIVPNIELPALCSPNFKSGPPSDQAQVSSQFLLNVIVNSGCIKTEDLVIKKGKLAWCLYIDLTCLDYDGNILDASVTAMLAALQNLKLPKVEIEEEKIKVATDSRRALTLHCIPMASTFGVFDRNVFIADPTNEEEGLLTSYVTMVTTDEGTICGIHKPGGIEITDEQLHECLKRTKIRTNHVIKMIDGAITSIK